MIRNGHHNPWRIWDPPAFPSAPVSNVSHCILHLKQLLCVQKFMGSLDQNPILNDKIEVSAYQSLLSSINTLINKPYLYYITVKCALTFISFIASVSLILCLIFVDIVWAVVSGVIVIGTFLCIRLAGNLYFKAMFKLKEELEPFVNRLQEEVLSNTDAKMFLGQYCSWLEFTNTGESIQRESSIKVFKVFNPGTVVPKGTISLPLIA